MFTRVHSSRPMKTARSRPRVDAEPVLDTAEVARHYKLSDATVLRWVDEGLPVKRYNQRLFRYKLSEVEKWLQNRGAK